MAKACHTEEICKLTESGVKKKSDEQQTENKTAIIKKIKMRK